MRKNILTIIILLSLLFACKNKTNQLKEWVYIEIGSDGFYGEISQEKLNTIENDSDSEKLILVENIRFIDDDSIVKDISIKTNEKGIGFYRINNIDCLEVLKKDPINTKTGFIKGDD